MSSPAPHFSADALAFLRALKRHNDREWFTRHKARFEASVKAPMVDIIEQLGREFVTLAPELVATPKASLYRIHRDTRFSHDKTPYKTHVAAVFPHHALPKHEGAALYLEVSTERVLIAGGLYAPQPPQLFQLREHIAAHHRQLASIVGSPGFRRAVGELGGESLTRVPRGFSADHPAADFLRRKQFLAGRVEPAALAASTTFYKTVVKTFAEILPLIRFLNAGLISRAE
jgi:uncharacterized protein (TIGR02453 family)